MTLKLVDAFSFMFKEKNWFVKILIGALLFFFVKVISLAMDVIHSDTLPRLGDFFINHTFRGSVILIVLYFAAIALLALSVWMHATACGYLLTSIRRYMRAEENILPDWDDVMGKLFRRGFKAFIAMFIYSIALFIFAKWTQIFVFTSFPFSPFLSLIVAFIATFVLVYAVFIIPALLLSFCEKDRFVAAFDVVRARQLLLKSVGQYFLTCIKLFLVLLLALGVVMFFFHSTVGVVILPIICFYFCIVKANILAQYYVNYCKEN